MASFLSQTSLTLPSPTIDCRPRRIPATTHSRRPSRSAIAGNPAKSSIGGGHLTASPFHARSLRVDSQPMARAYGTVTECGENLESEFKVDLKIMRSQSDAFAPATVANLGPGFDWLGCAIEGNGDVVRARVLDDKASEKAPKVIIENITGDNGRLSMEADKNCVGIAAAKTLELMGATGVQVGISLEKNLPLGSGMGSSAASAAAAAVAINGLFGSPLGKDRLVLAGLESERLVSGYHADNIAPAIHGNFVLIRSCDPLDIELIKYPNDLYLVIVNPKFEAPTKKMRAALPKSVLMSQLVHNCSRSASLVSGILKGNPKLLGAALDEDIVVEPVRGAYGCTISGAGPTCVAVVKDEEVGKSVMAAMSHAFETAGKLEVHHASVTKLNRVGAKLL